jgi:hypothetical protein
MTSIKSEFRMISGCADEQTAADVSSVEKFALPDPAGHAGGACTSALLKVLYEDNEEPDEDLTFKDVLLEMREILVNEDFTQTPQLSSSSNIDVDTKFDISQDGYDGTRRALMIGINYVGQNGELSGCHNDVLNMKEYLMDVHEFEEENMIILMDDGEHIEPTRDNIMAAYQQIVCDSEPGDVVYLHYSGHGGKLRDDDGDEEDGYDETLVPVDYETAGQIWDDELLRKLVIPMPTGVFVTCVMDCCHSGTVLDLPYTFAGDGRQTSMEETENFDFDAFCNVLEEEGVEADECNVLEEEDVEADECNVLEEEGVEADECA